MLAVLSTLTFDPIGFVEIDVLTSSKTGDTSRRVARIATLNGGAVVSDGGFSNADRVIELSWVPTSAAFEASVDRLVQLYQSIFVSTRDGVFLAVLETYIPGEKESRLRLLVISKVSI